MIVVDGRTDREKLVELLQLPEQTHLEFKSELDVTTKQDELNFVKDAVSMSNRPPGGTSWSVSMTMAPWLFLPVLSPIELASTVPGWAT